MRTTAASVLRRAATGTTSRRTFTTQSRLQATYGFIGLGRMGYPMAKNLRTKIPESDKLYIHDVNPAILEQFAKEHKGVTIAKHVREVAENSDTVLTVLPEPHHVQNVFQQMLKPPTLLSDAPVTSERLFIDCSTIDPRSSKEVANATHSSGQGKFIDAPMSGGVVGASAGKLTFMIGAPQELVDRATEVLSMMGKRVVHLGPQTSGLKGKLANNYLLALNNIATCEAMNMGVKWGLDAKALADMINTATGKCWPSEVNNPVPGVIEGSPASKGYEGGFGTALMLKDLKLAMQAAMEAEIIPRLGTQAADLYKAVEGDESLKGKDFSVVYRYLGGQDTDKLEGIKA
ncbi:putative 3-hydroxyisobutyrate dehydrogenase, mitochondrial [Fulvia fulva]|uniref:3-hydroxyisobutyrate dehydrogenase n=1 Tax=Passalora fulva TaxID=5499 RepID=A0A9Q8PEK5_PASFU|nr:putative 3-hydroxyisobutyrate dehydrogenase, mitochondrial [Fulvia fulva]KAK4617658.1 putative 3-hydroxyisobutyrate dehydrogenase, mitochondrial [Fulvia fulva]KAK4618611.1 putative 3-hydroxyisobutyrate dehydrogenase, mitochondrial [Fulvia fulva]UJO20987.1 putative 3-hydroxyisobutyrate dehydrogenase, mitochondrial [Fulvia fulva]WPV18300.1 putative 3-hydroxyisobutyrate dehydrogenase, mitochondrial [Fulvia fulva]WPV33428.1 putative 3-hydroxyisobutyrate dehydrogenase, mitochondrial [Fulvia fulv